MEAIERGRCRLFYHARESAFYLVHRQYLYKCGKWKGSREVALPGTVREGHRLGLRHS